MNATPTDRQLDILRHAIGIDKDVTLTGEPWRNRYAAAPNGEAAVELEAMVGMGLVKRGRVIPGGLVYFFVTEAGVDLVRADERKRRERAGLRLWSVTVWHPDYDARPQTHTVLARSRGAARWDRVRDLQDVGCEAREWLPYIHVRVAERKRNRVGQ